MPMLVLKENKALKLTNVLSQSLLYSEDYNHNHMIEQIIERMKSFIRARGAGQIGPLIQYINGGVNDEGRVVLETRIMLQCNTYIHNVKKPYSMESVIRVPNCMYCRYIGPKDKTKFAYDKIQLEAFEKEIPLKGSSYIVFVGNDELNDTVTTDVFMERADG